MRPRKGGSSGSLPRSVDKAGRWASWARPMLHGLGQARTLGLAAEMSFWVFLALIPLAVVAGFAAARIASAHLAVLARGLGALPAPARHLILDQVAQVAAWRGATVAPLTAGVFVWMASSGVHAVFDALELQTGTSRPWWKKQVLAVATCIALSVGCAVLAVLGAGLDWLAALAGQALPSGALSLVRGPVAHAIRWAIGALVAIAMVAALYRVAVPHDGPRDRPRDPALPGAAAAVALMVLLGWIYGIYVTKVGGSGSAYLAGLAVVGVTLMTLWLFSVALLSGAQLNRVLGDARVAKALRARGPWRNSSASSSPPTSPPPPSLPSTGPSSSPRGSEPPSR